MQKRTLKDYKTRYDALPTKNNLCGTAAIEAVKQNGNALRYVHAHMFDR